MTLVVGRISGGSVNVVSDTMLTHEMTKAPIPITKGLIKTKIITPALAVSFAGNSHEADKGIRMVQPMMSASEAAEALLDVHRSVELAHSTDFLIAALEPRPSLISIKDGKIEEGPIGWIGSYDAYRSYRALEIGETPPDPAIPGYAELGKGPAVSFSKMRSVMKHVIAEAAIADVGGFTIAVTNDGAGFNYMGYADVFFPPMTLSPGSHSLPFGTAAEGGYAYDVLATADRQGVSSYFPQGRFGILYWPRDGGFPEAEVIKNVDPFEFMDRAKERTGTLISTFHADVRILSARGHKKLVDGDTAGALADADRAITESCGREGWSLRGHIKSILGDETGALSDFEEAVRATPQSPECWNKLGLSRSRLGDKDGAIAAFGKAVEAEPNFWQAYANRANLFYEAGQADRALPDITQAAELAGNNAGLWKKVVAANQQLGRLKEAYQAAVTALSLTPEDRGLANFVAEHRSTFG
jgi:hypothetical protein